MVTDKSESPLTSDLDESSLAKKLFLFGLIPGIALRIAASILGDIGVYVDGASRIAMAIRWAKQPVWLGLSGVWPPAHLYLLGLLIRIWDAPVIVAKFISLICGIATLFVFRSAVRHRFGPTAASISVILLAVYWTHIWLTSSYWAEVPYLLFVLLATHYAEKAKVAIEWKFALGAGILLAMALLLRNEALLLITVFSLWFLLITKRPGIVLAFILLPVLLSAWYFIEPALRGGSYFDYFLYVVKSKGFENVVGNISRRDALFQWALMLGAAPTLIVVLPGLYGLWENRRQAITDLFAWMFVAQVGFYFSLTLVLAWRPQMRYLMLQFVNLLPYAALAWIKIIRRYQLRYALPVLVGLMIVIQSVAWWVGRNNRLPGGWLPLQVITAPQKIVDEYVAQANNSNPVQPIKLVSLVPGLLAERWSLEHSFVLMRPDPSRVSLEEMDVHVSPQILEGKFPVGLFEADLILIDPQTVYYPIVFRTLSSERPNLTTRKLHPHLEVILWSDRARRDLEQTFR